MAQYNNLGLVDKDSGALASLCSDVKTSRPVYRNLCLLSVIFGFSVGLLFGILVPLVYLRTSVKNVTATATPEGAAIRNVFLNNSFGSRNASKVSFVGGGGDGSFVEGGIFWGPRVERALPQGFQERQHAAWAEYVRTGEAVKLEGGCGRMQNRLVTFRDGLQGCVRYRQNTDQIQGELFSFYLAQLLRLPNLAPSTVSTVDLQATLWRGLATEVAAAQWHSHRPVVITQYVSDLDAAPIPQTFRPVERHLNRHDVLNMTLQDLVELAQWSDLIVFDYLTANLDRIVNNLYNYQWNVNIMDAPAHNLARKADSSLLLFLDNESGLLHGYRLLKKYEIYHSVLLDNLCLFRRQTAAAIRRLRKRKDVGPLLRAMFEEHNSPQVKDVLPTLPDKSVKILNDRIEKVYSQIVKCESLYSENDRT